jgi:hypothetical protein
VTAPRCCRTATRWRRVSLGAPVLIISQGFCAPRRGLALAKVAVVTRARENGSQGPHQNASGTISLVLPGICRPLSLSLSLSLSRQPKGIPCRVGSVAGWLHGTIRHLLAAARRGTRDPAVSACSLEAALEGPLEPEARTWSNPERTAVLSDLASVGPMLINRLPPPCREIARLQYLEGATRAEIRTYLRAWRPIGCEEVRRLLRLTHALLRAFGRGRSPAEEWPSGWCGGKNRWLTTPPPAL